MGRTLRGERAWRCDVEQQEGRHEAQLWRLSLVLALVRSCVKGWRRAESLAWYEGHRAGGARNICGGRASDVPHVSPQFSPELELGHHRRARCEAAGPTVRSDSERSGRDPPCARAMHRRQLSDHDGALLEEVRSPSPVWSGGLELGSGGPRPLQFFRLMALWLHHSPSPGLHRGDPSRRPYACAWPAPDWSKHMPLAEGGLPHPRASFRLTSGWSRRSPFTHPAPPPFPT